MDLVIVGGGLQGIEACYLAREAGYKTLLIDKDPMAPAAGLADRSIAADVTGQDPAIVAAIENADLVLPANENLKVLERLQELCRSTGTPMAFDLEAYRITESKIRSDRLFAEKGIPCPRYYPEGEPPYIAKPSQGSGSEGVVMLYSSREAESFLKAKGEAGEEYIVQEYLEGPSYSIEVTGVPGRYRAHQVTDIHVDEGYDCCMVTAPTRLSAQGQQELQAIALRLAELVDLHGIMDVEVIDTGKGLRVLEIDARLPSQTPIVVYRSTGVNLLQELVGIFVEESDPGVGSPSVEKGYTEPRERTVPRQVFYENYEKVNGNMHRTGEHCMRQAGPLSVRDNFLGAKQVITDYRDEESDFRGIFLNWQENCEEVTEWKDTLSRRLKG